MLAFWFALSDELAQSTASINYLPILLLLGIAVLIPVGALTVGRFLRQTNETPEKMMAYECGSEPVEDARGRFSVRYYMVAMLFLVFDVEILFLFPWAIIYDQLAWFGLIEMVVFLGILVVGYYYAWRKGALQWG